MPPGKPWFAWVHLFDPHAPYFPFKGDALRAPTREGDSDQALYAGEVRRADAAFEKLLKAVPKGTVVVLASDHGEGLMDHGEATHGPLCYGTTIDVLLAIRATGFAPGAEDKGLRSIMDVTPTLRRLCSLPQAEADARDLAGPPHETLVAETDRLDSAQLGMADVTSPSGYVLLGLTLDPRTGLGSPREYFDLLLPAVQDRPLAPTPGSGAVTWGCEVGAAGGGATWPSVHEAGVAADDRQIDEARSGVFAGGILHLHTAQVDARRLEPLAQAGTGKVAAGAAQRGDQQLGGHVALQAAVAELCIRVGALHRSLVLASDRVLALQRAGHHLREDHRLRKRPKILRDLRRTRVDRHERGLCPEVPGLRDEQPIQARRTVVDHQVGPGGDRTDMLKVRPDVKVIDDPYTGRPVVAFPAQKVDVAVIHAPIADRFGNASLMGNLAIDQEISLAAAPVIVTAEDVVDELGAPIDLTGLSTTAVVHAPRGAWPTSCYPHYPLDGEEILRYLEACAAGQFAEYVAAG